MNDRPTATELIAATRQYLERDLIPTLGDARLRFQTLIAANVLAIAERELVGEEDLLRSEWQWLAPLVGLTGPAPERLAALRQAVGHANTLLCQRIRAGSFDDTANFQSLARQLCKNVESKLAIANPRYLANAGQRAGAR
jgi:hypothetical protein